MAGSAFFHWEIFLVFRKASGVVRSAAMQSLVEGLHTATRSASIESFL